MLYFSDAFPGRIDKLTLDGKLVGMLGLGHQLKQFGGTFGFPTGPTCPTSPTGLTGPPARRARAQRATD